ncbi:hypothetical protein [Sphingomonas sanguinis]|uniref:Uncharacterized protein n=1 Tax=Sphingomonas sanguinis TaxID=33051 RepID=A0A147IKJ3_9SPHN|nr:hypothetical protein [Sphingomonas sanguinis]KTT95646.1 hypothetical protein SB4_17060 [Sphingomonas sanguinis]
MAGDSWDDRGSGQAPSRPRSDYIPKVRLIPTTLDDLMNRAGDYADAVKAHVEYTAVSTWLMKADHPLAAASIPVEAGNLSVLLTRQALEHEAGWPKLTSNAPPPLYDLPEDAQGIARRMAGDIHALWEAAGRPYLGANDCKFAFQYLAAAVRKGIIPPIPTLGEVDPVPAAKPAKPHILDMLKETT